MNQEGGFIKLIIIVVIALIILGYFGFDLKKAIEAPETQSNLTYVQQIVSNVWHNYLEKPAKYLWNVFIKSIWSVASENLFGKKGSTPPAVTSSSTPP